MRALGSRSAIFVAGAVDEQPARRQPAHRARPGIGDRGLGVLAQDIEGAHDQWPLPARQWNLEAAQGEAQPGPGERLGSQDAGRIDFDAHHLDVGSDPPEAVGQLQRRDGGGAVPQVDHGGWAVGIPTQSSRLRAAQPTVAPPQPVGVGRAAGDDSLRTLSAHADTLGGVSGGIH